MMFLNRQFGIISLIRNLVCTCSIGVTQEFSKLTTSLIHSKTAFHPLTLFVINLTQDVISYSTLALLTASLKVGKNSLLLPRTKLNTTNINGGNDLQKIFRSKPPPTCEKRLLNFGYQQIDTPSFIFSLSACKPGCSRRSFWIGPRAW